MEEITTKEAGNSLESAIEYILNIANIKTENNSIISGYEIDIKAEIGDRLVIIECKNYQNSTMIIRNLIHQWNSKNNLIGANKIILAIAGLVIKQTDRDLASEFDMEIWSQEEITELFNLSLEPNKLKEKLLNLISLKPISIAEGYRPNLIGIVIKNILTGNTINDEILYRQLNKWLRAYIITELYISDTNKRIREDHIALFEGSKTKTTFFSLIKKKRDEIDYWNTVYKRLDNEEILDNELQQKYRSYMDQLKTEYDTLKLHFENIYNNKNILPIIHERLKIAQKQNDFPCEFTYDELKSSVDVNYDHNSYIISIKNVNSIQGNIINWILTSEYNIYKIDDKNMLYYWIFSNLNEASEMVTRLFTEFFEISEKNHLRDKSMF
ncbi:MULTISPECIES: hypothetical protein [unclassified Oceanispirochaeta]|uniref:hypothetical protein n=1 Tax=unclassified Oceanispirochaeta TaxID=2635722 RepID=UPI000E0950A2|nr:MULTISPECIES: hypothetical protein [unclassified Oceanispirochaeta]MBF9018484.1 hypothetical protein [Oceanispirochaeta sp. M2]NPD74891.1 hypothetical protein [Oceanispirochaeta sp. M1]RDG29278.1 hypothetical protein DV872_22600 [Oceanispirochaeta sp. M1]